MKSQANDKSKNKSFLLSNQVKQILHKNGLSKVFNYSDYKYFKEKSANAFNKAQEIANYFISENQEQSDLMEYNF